MTADLSLQRPEAASPRTRVWRHRLLAVCAGPLLCLLLLEAGLRLGGYGHPARFLIPDSQPRYLRTNPDFLNLFMSDRFGLQPLNFRVPARKRPNALRIVVLGESAAQGVPAPEFGFAAQLRAQLRHRFPGRNVEVLNAGIVAINSHIVRQVAGDLAEISPDLFVVYMGNNEVVGPYGPGCSYVPAMLPRWLIRLDVLIHTTRTGQLFQQVLGRFATRARPGGGPAGMDVFVSQSVGADDPRLETVYRNFEANLTDIVRTARSTGARTLLCTVVGNLKDWPPILSEHRKGLSADDLARWNTSFERGRLEWRLGESAAARTDLEAARRIDPHHAETLYLLGTLELKLGETAAARAALVDADRYDAVHLRADPRINEIIRDVAHREPGIDLLDAAVLLGSDPASTATPAGRELLFEHVHFHWNGNYLLARSMAEAIGSKLPGGQPASGTWLDSDACAAALAYTPPAQVTVLQSFLRLIEGPPFTNQLNHLEELARVERAISRLQGICSAEVVQQSLQVVRTALAADPDNPALVKLQENLADDAGEAATALSAVQRRTELEPATFALATDLALHLMRVRRFDEARKLLDQTASECPRRDLGKLAPAFAELYLRTNRQTDGVRRLDALMARTSEDAAVRVSRGMLEKSAGDAAAAERDFRTALSVQPSSSDALEDLERLLEEAGRTREAEELTLSSADAQSRNHANNLRAAAIARARGDDAQVIRFLLAAEQSGPMNAAMEMHLASRLSAAGRRIEALEHLAIARELARIEDNAEAVNGIDRILHRVDGGYSEP